MVFVKRQEAKNCPLIHRHKCQRGLEHYTTLNFQKDYSGDTIDVDNFTTLLTFSVNSIMVSEH